MKIDKNTTIHFIGIGGAGMSGLAYVLLKRGYKIQGSDVIPNFWTKKLKQLGAKIFFPQKEENITENIDLIVRSSAIKEDNPEYIKAKKLDIPIWHRSQMLAYLVNDKELFAIAGTHGKTTTSSLLTSILNHNGLNPIVFIGAEFDEIQGNAKDGSGKYAVIEADESDGSFLNYTPYASIVTNIEEDHLDFYTDLKNIQDYFLKFLKNHKKNGYSIMCGDNYGISSIKQILKKLHIPVYFYGQGKDNDFIIKNIEEKLEETTYSIFYKDKEIERITITLKGLHNVYNSAATFIISYLEKWNTEKTKLALFNFKGPQRRFEIKGEVNKILVIDDYGHHPTEIKTTLKPAKKLSEKRKGKLVTIFQPHRYSRTAKLLKDFANAFENTDILILMDIYSAGEKNEYNISIKDLYREILNSHVRPPKVLYFPHEEKLLEFLWETLMPNDILMTIGAGNVYKIGEKFLKNLHEGCLIN